MNTQTATNGVVYGQLKLDVKSVSNLSFIDDYFLSVEPNMLISNTSKQSFMVNVEDLFIEAKANVSEAEVSLSISLPVESLDESAALFEANSKLNDLNIRLPYIVLTDIIGNLTLCEVPDQAKIEWESFFI
ncbi:hypothetical protein [Heyndrickxia acidicola]|uniref:Uncharacterized protein n=1 Tax=Heyndrickxia acidicola TaxID=209389 RepID=A0ABU6MNB4_9BACI|nr:hypothetical protein [Heyndrickxia acidicola]MED1206168.1 hypothetical protein [Heyndrickxia acidicola]